MSTVCVCPMLVVGWTLEIPALKRFSHGAPHCSFHWGFRLTLNSARVPQADLECVRKLVFGLCLIYHITDKHFTKSSEEEGHLSPPATQKHTGASSNLHTGETQLSPCALLAISWRLFIFWVMMARIRRMASSRSFREAMPRMAT